VTARRRAPHAAARHRLASSRTDGQTGGASEAALALRVARVVCLSTRMGHSVAHPLGPRIAISPWRTVAAAELPLHTKASVVSVCLRGLQHTGARLRGVCAVCRRTGARLRGVDGGGGGRADDVVQLRQLALQPGVLLLQLRALAVRVLQLLLRFLAECRRGRTDNTRCVVGTDWQTGRQSDRWIGWMHGWGRTAVRMCQRKRQAWTAQQTSQGQNSKNGHRSSRDTRSGGSMGRWHRRVGAARAPEPAGRSRTTGGSVYGQAGHLELCALLLLRRGLAVPLHHIRQALPHRYQRLDRQADPTHDTGRRAPVQRQAERQTDKQTDTQNGSHAHHRLASCQWL
jgi:hypothetical protein